MINFILLNVAVVFTSIALVKKVFYSVTTSDKVCTFSILFLAQIILTEMILGLSGVLFLKNLIFLNFFIMLFVCFILRNRKVELRSVGGGNFTWIVENKTILFCFSCILGFLLGKSFFNLINPSFGWDSLNYHFTFPVEWLKHGNLYIPPTICGDPTPTYYPINNCLYYFWLIAPFKNVFIADLGQIPFLLLSFIACFSIARKFKLSRELSFYSAGLFIIIPNFFKQIEVGYADIMMAALFFVTLNSLFNLNKRFNLGNLILSGASLGIFLGTKTLSSVYSLVLIIFFVYILVKCSKGLRLISYGSLFFILILLFGGYGYVRNFISSGNPLFPFNLVLFGKTIFKGVMPTSTYLVRWTSEGYNLYKLFFREGMGIQLLLLVFPATFLAFPIVFAKRKRERLSFPLIYFLLLPAVLYFVFRYFIPQLWTRFLYPYLGIGMIVAVYLLNFLKVPLKVIKIIIIICFLASIFEFCGYWELGLSLVATLVFFFVLPYLFRIFRGRRTKIDIVFFLFVVLSVGFVFGERWYLNHEYERYITYAPYQKGAMEAWKWLNEQTKGERIAYTGWPIPFPLYGTDFKNDVYYVSVNNVHPAQLHFFPQGNLNWKEYRTDTIDIVSRRDENYRGRADFNQWYKNLFQEKTDYLFIYIFKKTNYVPVEGEWAQAHPDKFKLTFDSPDARIYKVIK